MKTQGKRMVSKKSNTWKRREKNKRQKISEGTWRVLGGATSINLRSTVVQVALLTGTLMMSLFTIRSVLGNKLFSTVWQTCLRCVLCATTTKQTAISIIISIQFLGDQLAHLSITYCWSHACQKRVRA